MTEEPLIQRDASSVAETESPAILQETQSQESPLLLPEHARRYRQPLQYLTGVTALALLFFASASFTVAYLSTGSEVLSGKSQTAAAATVEEDPFASISLTADGVYVLDIVTNRILYSKNPDISFPLASLAKVPLVLAVSEVFGPDSRITIPPHVPPDGAGIRLPTEMRFAAQDIIHFTLVASSNEGAAILAEVAEDALRLKYPLSTPGSAALWRMNDIVKNLGLNNMQFLNVTGLDLDDTQASAFGSAHDVALLFKYAASTAPISFGRTSHNTIKIYATTGEFVSATNTDEALPAIPGIIMGKTGYTQLAGGNLAVVFEAGPARPVVAVVLHSTQDGRFEDMKKIVAATLDAISQDQ